MNGKENNEWWRGGVFYQIYPRSFMDKTGNGIGDLPGITEKLDYIADLGVDAIWISPFFKSPMKDFGYDISDYRNVDPLFGTIDDFKKLLDKAHSLNLKIIIDMVMSHTSDQHKWFIESRRNKDNPKSDWYVWADPKPDGTPPNNWQSIFGGASWTFETKRGQYYMHNFLKEQPDLNYHNPEVQKAMLDECRYWFELGIDGLRLDVINFCFHDRELRDNPPQEKTDQYTATQLDFKDPYGMQMHIYDKSRPEMFGFIKKLRALSNEYPDSFLLGEIGDNKSIELAAEYTKGEDRLHTTYSFALMHGRTKELTASLIRNALEEQLKHAGNEGWPSWAMSNHDVVRTITRFGGDNAPKEMSKMLIALLSCLRGTIFLYQGEELGLPEAEIPYEKIQDPWGKVLWPEWQGRDGCRTPIPWNKDKKNAGFSVADNTWLPIPEEHYALAINEQNSDKGSTLNFARKFLKWRKEQPALITGDIEFHDFNDDKVLGFTRSHKEQTIFCVFNLSDKEKSLMVPDTTKETKIILPPFGQFYSPSDTSSS